MSAALRLKAPNMTRKEIRRVIVGGSVLDGLEMRDGVIDGENAILRLRARLRRDRERHRRFRIRLWDNLRVDTARSQSTADSSS